MPVITINNFGNGMARDYVNGGVGEFSVSKHFDILTFPNRLQPLRAVGTDTTAVETYIKNIIVSPTTGYMFGLGKDELNPTHGKLWKRSGYGGTDVWGDVTPTDQTAGVAIRDNDYAFLVENPDAGQAKTLYWASTNLLLASDPNGLSSKTTEALTFITISQGFVHPKTKEIYFGYQTGTEAVPTASYIGIIKPNATAFGDKNFTALQLPKQCRPYHLTSYGDYLAIATSSPVIGSGINQSDVFLWDMVSSSWNERIPWGIGSLKVLNNLNGVLVGVSALSSNNVSATIQDQDKILIKVYAGGAEPLTAKQIVANRITTTTPSCTINPNVNFVYNDRFYFSINVVNGDSDANYYGLWSFGKNEFGSYVTTIERSATLDGSETGVLAAAIAGDFVSMAHTSAGTMTCTINGTGLDSIFNGTSVYESCLNPEMPNEDKRKKKKLVSVFATYLPLPDDATVVMKYRVDSTKADSWTTIFTETTNDATRTERSFTATGIQFTDGTNYEFRLESVDGAIITSFGYRYDTYTTQV